MVSDIWRSGYQQQCHYPDNLSAIYHLPFSTSDLNEKRVVSDCQTGGAGSRWVEIVVGAVPDADVEFVD